MYDRTGTTSNALLSQWNENMNKLREYIANLLTKIANFIRPKELNFKELSSVLLDDIDDKEVSRLIRLSYEYSREPSDIWFKAVDRYRSSSKMHGRINNTEPFNRLSRYVQGTYIDLILRELND
jgi:hypothetical protein